MAKHEKKTRKWEGKCCLLLVRSILGAQELYHSRWSEMLQNAHIPIKMYMIEDDQILYVTERGEDAKQIIEFLQKQDDVAEVTLDQQKYPGKAAGKQAKKPEAKPPKKKKRRRKKRRKSKKSKKDEL